SVFRTSPGCGSGISRGIDPTSMIVDKLDVVRLAVPPNKAKPPLVVDADRVPTRTVARKRLQPIARRNAQILQPRDRVEHEKLRHRAFRDITRHAFRRLAPAKRKRALVAEAADHSLSVLKTSTSVKIILRPRLIRRL